MLNYNHCPSRNEQTTKIDNIKQLAYSYKQLIVTNVVSNVIGQNKKDTLIEFASLFDMARPITRTNV